MLVTPGSDQSLADALRVLLSNPDAHRALKEAATRNLEHHTLDRMADEILSVYTEFTNTEPRLPGLDALRMGGRQ